MPKNLVNKKGNIAVPSEKNFFEDIAVLIKSSRQHVVSQVNSAMVVTYYEIGRRIVEHEQQGARRAEYGKSVLQGLADYLTENIGKGYSAENLKLMRRFYMAYSDNQISQTVFTKFNKPISKTVFTKSENQIGETVFTQFETENPISETPIRKSQEPILESLIPKFKTDDSISKSPIWKFENEIQETVIPKFNPRISWSHYMKLMRISNIAERQFYEIEIAKNNWSFREFERQFDSSLYERLALSTDKDKVLALSQKGQIVEHSKDIIKHTTILEFLGLQAQASYSENELETAIISNLQLFLLELGSGFLFEARQKRFSFGEKNFFVDLVFYNRLLQCYVLIDLKTGTLKHQDLGQMQMYVNYYDRYVKRDFEKPTIGILLCKEKDDNIVELTLSKEANIYASEYNLYLPDKALLQRKLQEWADEFEEQQIKNK
ncbi:MAG: PDDEXK nuclease domain-containing protein [Prevotellaceae bacterium]|nr:PDDEXK nuclease domain-containing protein [Prevotellaceae bacterium]